MSKLGERLTALATMSPAQLRAQWQRLYGVAPPAIAPHLLRLSLAYRLQEKVHGGLAKTVKRELERLAAGNEVSAARSSSARIRPGTRLIRSWQGRSLSVLAVEDGFQFEDRVYPSLTAIACHVTGARHSGPRFFGLTGHA